MLKKVCRRVSKEEIIYNMAKQQQLSRGTLVEVHIADIHFGAFDSKTQYDILEEQFLKKINNIRFDILSIDGDLLDHKYMSNSDPVLYATLFISKIVERCKEIGATLVIIAGTFYHDANQLKLFYHYLQDPNLDLRIVEKVQFEYIKGAKILCIPELYNMGSDYYNKYLFGEGHYDSVFMHGTIKGAVYQARGQESGINSESAPVFTMDDFVCCRGPILSGHVHGGGCFNKYFYYCGSPLRWKYGEENEKGFLIVLHNLDTQAHYTYIEPIKSFRYDTIDANDIIIKDPQEIISYLNQLQQQGIDHIRLDLTKILSDKELANLDILKGYYRNNSSINFKYNQKRQEETKKALEQISEEYKEYGYILDPSIDPYTKFVMYVNQKQKEEYITVEELKSILQDI